MQSTQQTPRTPNVFRRWHLALAAFAVLFVVATFATMFARHPDHVNHDVALYLYTGKLILTGARPYVDFIEINPPLVMYLSTLPALVAQLFSTTSIAAFDVIWLAALALSMAATIRYAPRAIDQLHPVTAIAGAAALALAAAQSTIHLGQREQWFTFALIPWILLRSTRTNAQPAGMVEASLVGLATGILASVKPHFFALIVASEAALLLGRRAPRTLFAPEILALATAPLLYAAHFFFWPATMRDAFFARWLPEISAAYGVYAARGLVDRFVAERSYMIQLAACTAALVPLVLPHRIRLAVTPLSAFAAAALAGFALYLQQNKGWGYHLVPSQTLVLCAAAMLTAHVARRAASALARNASHPIRDFISTGITLALPLIMLASVAHAVFVTDVHPPRANRTLAGAITQTTRKGDAVLILDSSVAPAFPAMLVADREPGSRYLWTFPLAFALHDARRVTENGAARWVIGAEKQAFIDRVLSEMVEDIATRNPLLILVKAHDKSQALPGKLRVESYLKETGWLDKFTARYKPSGRVGAYNAYRRE